MVCFCALYMCERYRIYHVCECKCCMNVAWWHMMNVRSAAVCPPSSLSSRWPLCCFLFLSSSISPSMPLSFSAFFITPPFLSFPFLQDHFQLLCSLHVHPCKTAHVNTVTRTHTPLCLYLIIGSITRDIFPDNATEGGEPDKAEWEGGDLSIPHHMEATVLALPLTEMNEFNISPFWSTDDLLMRLSVSLSQEVFIIFFFCSACEICTGRHLKGFWQRLICFVAWRDSCISLSI